MGETLISRRGRVALMCGIALACMVQISAAHETAHGIVLEDVGFATPAAARFDEGRDRYLVSSMNGSPVVKDNNGFISVVTPNGKMANLRWIAGGKKGVELHAPKGFAIRGDSLYVADIDLIRVFDANTGRLTQNITVPGAKVLQDVAIAVDGSIYACDSGSNPNDGAIFKIVDGKAELIAQGVELFRPNALALLPDNNLIVTPGIGSTLLHVSPQGKLLDLSAFPSMLMPFQPRSPENLSGVVVLNEKSVLVASREGKTVARVRLDHDPAFSSYVEYTPDIKTSTLPGGTLAMTQRADRVRAEQAAGKVTDDGHLGDPVFESYFKSSKGAGQAESRARKPYVRLLSYFVRAPERESEFFVSNVSDPAKIGLDTKRGRILVPQITSNALLIAPLPAGPTTAALQ